MSILIYNFSFENLLFRVGGNQFYVLSKRMEWKSVEGFENESKKEVKAITFKNFEKVFERVVG